MSQTSAAASGLLILKFLVSEISPNANVAPVINPPLPATFIRSLTEQLIQLRTSASPPLSKGKRKISDGAVCRTAPVTPGLLKRLGNQTSWRQQPRRQTSVTRILTDSCPITSDRSRLNPFSRLCLQDCGKQGTQSRQLFSILAQARVNKQTQA